MVKVKTRRLFVEKALMIPMALIQSQVVSTSLEFFQLSHFEGPGSEERLNQGMDGSICPSSRGQTYLR